MAEREGLHCGSLRDSFFARTLNFGFDREGLAPRLLPLRSLRDSPCGRPLSLPLAPLRGAVRVPRTRHLAFGEMAEREGFEPSVPLRVHMISNHAHA